MHEMSIAQQIVEIIHQYVPLEDRGRVRSVRVRVGEAAGVVPDSLEFCFSAITIESNLVESRMKIEQVPFVLDCNACSKQSASTPGLAVCPLCGSFETRILSGTELNVVDIEIADSVEET